MTRIALNRHPLARPRSGEPLAAQWLLLAGFVLARPRLAAESSQP